MFALSPLRMAWYLLVLSLAAGPLTLGFSHGHYCGAMVATAEFWLLVASVATGFAPHVTKPQRKGIVLGALLTFLAQNLIFVHW
jgi:hypothetical protein